MHGTAFIYSLLLVFATVSLSSGFIASIWKTEGRSKLLQGESGDSIIEDDDEISKVLRQAACDRSVPSSDLLPVLQSLENQRLLGVVASIPKEKIDGTFELIYSSAVTTLPVVGSWWDGYLPNKETIIFDLEKGELNLQVETLPFVPTVDIVGENLTYDEASAMLEYAVKGKSKTSSWSILYADRDVIAAKSSVTGLNVIRRLS